MAGRYAKKETLQEPLDYFQTKSAIPARATRQLQALQTQELPEIEEEYLEPQVYQLHVLRFKMSQAFDKIHAIVTPPKPLRFTPSSIPAPVSIDVPYKPLKVVDSLVAHPLDRHKPWLYRFIIVSFVVVISMGVLLSAAMLQRPGDAQLINLPGFGKVYDVQVGGSLASQIQNTNGPQTPKVPLHTGPYSVLGAPSISVDFINQVLDAYHSPAAGQGQALYDLGVKYGIDPAFALAFFQHESSFGTAGEARSSLSLGNLRCIPDAQCTDNYAWFPTWQAGFEAWYKLILNLYVAVWGLTTVDQIIPKYAPTADNNNEAAYIAALKRELDAWHTGQIYS
jgi:hypothetical protein